MFWEIDTINEQILDAHKYFNDDIYKISLPSDLLFIFIYFSLHHFFWTYFRLFYDYLWCEDAVLQSTVLGAALARPGR